MRIFMLLLLPVAATLSGCGAASLAVSAVDAAAGIVGTAVDVTAGAVGTAVDAVTYPIQ